MAWSRPILLAGLILFAAPPPYPRNLIKADIERWMTELSNWGRWGKDDQAGTINLITAAKRKAAAALVRDGVSVSMSLNADSAPEWVTTAPAQYTWQHTMRTNGLDRTDGYVIDGISVFFHGNNTTHLDAVSHFMYQGHIYNGYPVNSINTWGATKDDVMPYKNGIVTRGVLVDIPWLKNKPFLDDDEAIYPEDLLAWEKKTGIKIESGDAVFIRTGRWARVAAKGPLDLNRVAPGIYASTGKWLHERDIAILGSDAVTDVRPSRVEGVNQPIHQLFLVAVGTPLFDNCDLEAVSKAAAERNRWVFLMTAAALAVPGATGGPVNPRAIF